MFKKVLSYFIPVTIFRQKSNVSKALEVTWANGELVLDSQNTNYSYGSLQRILRKGLKSIGFEKVRNMDQILVLGVAGGSVIKTIVDEIDSKAHITGVEIDKDVIGIAYKYFGMKNIPNLEIINDDAFEFVLKPKRRYNLVIIDIFQDSVMPAFLFEEYFAQRVAFLLERNGFIMFNTMILKEEHNQRNVNYLSQFSNEKFRVKTIPRVERHNEVIIIEKLD